MIAKFFGTYWVALLLALGAFSAAFGTGWTLRAWKCDAALLASAEATRKEEGRLQTHADDTATEYEADRRAIDYGNYARQERVRTIYRNRTVPDDCAVPDDARRMLAEAVNAANTDSPGQSGEQLPRAAGAATNPR